MTPAFSHCPIRPPRGERAELGKKIGMINAVERGGQVRI
jgi:hypothetical protein